MKKKFTIRRVPLELLLGTLDELWKMGVNYVDLEGTTVSSADEQDRIEFIVADDYYSDVFTPTPFSPDNYEFMIYMGP